jgi:hypothetical protein
MAVGNYRFRIVLFSIVLLTSILTTQKLSAQQVSLQQLVDFSYQNSKFFDSVVWVRSPDLAFLEHKVSGGRVTVMVRRNEYEFKDMLSDQDILRLDISLLEIYSNRLLFRLNLNHTNQSSYNTGQFPFLVYYDERTVECILTSEGRWKASRVLKVKSHITD